MDSLPVVSIRLMVYNNEDYIHDTLKGILIQKVNFPVEVVVGDDFSQDNTLSIIRTYKNTEFIKFKILERQIGDEYWHKRQAKGRLYNFVDIINNCKGKYIALCDGDDYWTDPFKLQKQVDFLEANSNYAICFHNIEIYDQEQQTFQNDHITRKVQQSTDIIELSKGNYMHTPSVLLRNDFKIPNWFVESSIGDWCLYMIIIGNRKIRKFDEIMAVYRVHNESIWSKQSADYRQQNTKRSVRLLLNNEKFTNEVRGILASRGGVRIYPKERRGKYFFKKLLQKLRLK